MEKDTKWEAFFDDNRRYADIINGLGCKGRQLIRADDLQEANGRSGKRNRDTLRKAALGMNFVIVGIESQERIDYRMPFRNMAYDVGRYGKQIVEIRRKVRDYFNKGKDSNTKDLASGEYLYGFRKKDRLYPVITFVLYSGEEPWDGARSLHEILDFTNVPESLKDMTPDYKINVIEIRKFEQTEVFQTDVKQVFDFIRLSEDKEALLKLIENDDSYKHMEEDAFEVIASYTNSIELRKQMEEMNREEFKEGERKDMCRAIRELMEDSREAGLAEGISMGRAEGHVDGRIEGETIGRVNMLCCFFSNGGTAEDAVRMLAATEEEIEAARNMG